jgi:hypothetical protein
MREGQEGHYSRLMISLEMTSPAHLDGDAVPGKTNRDVNPLECFGSSPKAKANPSGRI